MLFEDDREWLASTVAASFRKYERWKFSSGAIGLMVITICLAAWNVWSLLDQGSGS
jgi:hypothetical protein